MRSLQMMYWKFLPSFATDPKNFKLSTTNADSANLLTSRMWKDSFLKRPCLIPADTFIEWQTDGRAKLPWMFAMQENELFALGGIWRHWRSPDGQSQMDTYAVITVKPNELVDQTTHHDRMPLIVKRSDCQRWLEPGNPKQPPVDLLRPFDSDQMKAWRTDARINSVKNNDPTLSEELKGRRRPTNRDVRVNEICTDFVHYFACLHAPPAHRRTDSLSHFASGWWAPKPNDCHDNVSHLVRLNPHLKPALGWIFGLKDPSGRC